jgi:hypothetical protein
MTPWYSLQHSVEQKGSLRMAVPPYLRCWGVGVTSGLGQSGRAQMRSRRTGGSGRSWVAVTAGDGSASGG